MQTVYLNGGISKFGQVWTTNCKNISSIFKLISCQTEGFRKYLIDAANSGIGFEIQRGSEFLETPEELLLSLRDEDIIITEVPSGSKSGGAKILAAIAIAIAAPYIGGQVGYLVSGGSTVGQVTVTGAQWAAATTTALYGTAINLGIQGVTQLLAPGPETDGLDENDGYLFDGPTNNVQQGLPVPVLYGELIIGGSPVSVEYSNNPFRVTAVGSIVNLSANSSPAIVIRDSSGNKYGQDGKRDEDNFGVPQNNNDGSSTSDPQ